jgi:hypothetical protein
MYAGNPLKKDITKLKAHEIPENLTIGERQNRNVIDEKYQWDVYVINKLYK